MELLCDDEVLKVRTFFEKAADVARRSTCERNKCGAVIILNGEIVGEGFNSPPGNLESQRRCTRKHEILPGFKSDRTCCVHAEVRATTDLLTRNPDKVSGSTLYFMRLDEQGEMTRAGRPYCTICSKAVLDAGIGYFALWHEEGIVVYSSQEYNDVSFLYDGE